MSRNFVLIDPEPDVVMKVTGYLENDERTIMGVSGDYEEGIATIKTGNVGAVVIGMEHNSIEGIKSIAKIRILNPKIKILVVAHSAPDQQFITNCKKLDVADILVLPFSEQRFQTALEKMSGLDDSSVRGTVVCVGYTPSRGERQIMKVIRMEYFQYPSCHLAINYFNQNRFDKLCFIIISESIDMFSKNRSAMSARDRILLEKRMKKQTDAIAAWMQVLRAAQISYQNYWNEAILEGLLPQYLPALSVINPVERPKLVPTSIMDEMGIPILESDKSFSQFELNEKEGGESFQNIAGEINQCMIRTEEKFPHLFESSTAEENKPRIAKRNKIDTKPVKIVPESRKNTSRMASRDR